MTSLKSCHFIPSNHNCGLIVSSVGRTMPGAMPASSNLMKMDIKPTNLSIFFRAVKIFTISPDKS